MAGGGASGKAVVKRAHAFRYGLLAAVSLLAAPPWALLGIREASPALLPIRFYQRVASPIDGRDCPSWPTCSQYALQAVRAHGLLVGSWLAIDRLIHEADDLRRPAWVRAGGRLRSFDPLSRNDFWLRKKGKE